MYEVMTVISGVTCGRGAVLEVRVTVLSGYVVGVGDVEVSHWLSCLRMERQRYIGRVMWDDRMGIMLDGDYYRGAGAERRTHSLT
ncbi:hypothetical protein Tco_0286988 [Tanacetum coccineum]